MPRYTREAQVQVWQPDGGEGYITRGVSFTLDPSPAQERLLRSYCGSARVAHNWAIAWVKENLSIRAAERMAGVVEADLTPTLSWSTFSLGKAFNTAKTEAVPWWREVSMHAFRLGITQAAEGLANLSAAKKGTRKGRPVGFPHVKSRNRSTPTISFVEINHQLSWLRDDRHAVRLICPSPPRTGTSVDVGSTSPGSTPSSPPDGSTPRLSVAGPESRR
jgi:hypothetical protein